MEFNAVGSHVPLVLPPGQGARVVVALDAAHVEAEQSDAAGHASRLGTRAVAALAGLDARAVGPTPVTAAHLKSARARIGVEGAPIHPNSWQLYADDDKIVDGAPSLASGCQDGQDVDL